VRTDGREARHPPLPGICVLYHDPELREARLKTILSSPDVGGTVKVAIQPSLYRHWDPVEITVNE
jgi:hypothetical protein